MTNKYRFSIPSRIHLTLISMGASQYRNFGGIGFAISGLDLVIEIKLSAETKIIDKRDKGVPGSKIKEYVEKIEKVRYESNFQHGINVLISGGAPPHTGFGTGTATILCLLEALYLVNKKNISSNDLVRLSKRGGTSGIGINTYFSGGFILDLGRVSNAVELVPSSYQVDVENPPLALQKIHMPKWGMAVCIPQFTKSYYGISENEFFKSVCPIGEIDVNETLSHSVLGVTASVAENDYDRFCLAVNNIQECTWKKKERELYGSFLTSVEKIIRSHADASAMSSMGPGIVFFSKNIDNAITNISNELGSSSKIYRAYPNNVGRIISGL